jgi:hypothetical protein
LWDLGKPNVKETFGPFASPSRHMSTKYYRRTPYAIAAAAGVLNLLIMMTLVMRMGQRRLAQPT